MSDCAFGIAAGKRPRMPKPKVYEGNLFIRALPGMKALVERLRGKEPQGHFLRRVLGDALEDMDAGRWQPRTPPHEPKGKKP